MNLFSMLDKLHETYKNNDEIMTYNRNTKKYVFSKSIKTENKCENIQAYKHQYYLDNIELYRQRNTAYRQRKKEEKKNII